MSIETIRQEIARLLTKPETKHIIADLYKQVQVIRDYYVSAGITALANKLMSIRLEQYQKIHRSSQLPTQFNKEAWRELGRHAYFTAATLRHTKHTMRKQLKREGAQLRVLVQELLAHADHQALFDKYQQLLMLLYTQAQENPQVFFTHQDSNDAYGVIIKLPSLYEKLLVLSLFSSAALMQAYAGACLKLFRTNGISSHKDIINHIEIPPTFRHFFALLFSN